MADCCLLAICMRDLVPVFGEKSKWRIADQRKNTIRREISEFVGISFYYTIFFFSLTDCIINDT